MTDDDDDHTCGQDHVRALRLIMAALESNEYAYQLCVSEFIDCPGCADAVVRWLVSMVAGDIALQSNGIEAAANGVATAIAREMGWVSR
jgi:hypothetical protein